MDNEWKTLLEERRSKLDQIEGMGGKERLEKQKAKGRLNARERIAALADPGSFAEIGAFVGSGHPAGSAAVPADGLVGGTVRLDGRPAVVLAEDFTVQGGSIGHGNHAKRLRLALLAEQEGIPLVLMLDGAGERASNALERYAYAPNDLQIIADLVGKVPVVTLILGTSAGHGALSGVFADLIIMTEGSAVFAAGPPLVQAALGVNVTSEELGGSDIHVRESGLVHNLAATEAAAFDTARRFLAFLPSSSGDPIGRTNDATTTTRVLDDVLDVIPRNTRRSYDMHDLLGRLVDGGSLLEVQPSFGASIITAFARLGGFPVLIVANQPAHLGGAITGAAAEKAAHFLEVAGAFGVPVVFLADNPGVMAGPEAEKAGTLRSAARMYRAQRRLNAPKLHVTLRKAFGFGSSLMAMNPFDGQTVTLALPGISLGGIPAFGGSRASGASEDEERALAESQQTAWIPADNGSYDRVIDPRDLRNELVAALERRLPG